MQQRLWAPWRAQYVREDSETPDPDVERCFLCRAIASDNDRENLLVWRRDHSVVMLNRFPYNNGHLLIAPLVHRGTLGELTGSDLFEPIETIRVMIERLDRFMRPQGYNVGLNQGSAAGAGLPGHLHWHVVPRWDGDANFMPILANTKVIVESLLDYYDRLAEAIGQPELLESSDEVDARP